MAYIKNISSVNVDGKDINVYQIGKQDSQQTIVYIQGLGSGDTVISTRPLFDKLKDNFNICLVDRAGNGMSSDTKEERTVEEIVEEYRMALKYSTSTKQYILMAHSIGGMYAEYWASLYPDEVEAIIYLDATPAECYVEEGKPKVSTLAIAKAENIFCSTGLQRLLLSKDMLIGKDENDIYTDKEEELRLSLMYRNTYSDATYFEMKLYYDNAEKVLNSRKIKDIPKLYIVADSYNGAYFDNVYKERLNKEYDGDNEKIEEKIENPTFFVFSNDMEWVKENIQINSRVFYVDINSGDDSYKDMQLMSKCKHNIIANSSFSWWGAWLNENKNKIVVAPKKWINRDDVDSDNIELFCENWTLL